MRAQSISGIISNLTTLLDQKFCATPKICKNHFCGSKTVDYRAVFLLFSRSCLYAQNTLSNYRKVHHKFVCSLTESSQLITPCPKSSQRWVCVCSNFQIVAQIHVVIYPVFNVLQSKLRQVSSWQIRHLSSGDVKFDPTC